MRHAKLISIFIILTTLAVFIGFEILRKSERYVIGIERPDVIQIDMNGNKILDAGETVCIEQIETLTSDLTKNQSEIANKLGDNNEWKTHGRPIDIETLKSLKLQITDFSNKPERDAIRNYYKISRDFIARHNFSLFIHTRTFL